MRLWVARTIRLLSPCLPPVLRLLALCWAIQFLLQDVMNKLEK